MQNFLGISPAQEIIELCFILYKLFFADMTHTHF
jgi:hypothetical protein